MPAYATARAERGRAGRTAGGGAERYHRRSGARRPLRPGPYSSSGTSPTVSCACTVWATSSLARSRIAATALYSGRSAGLSPRSFASSQIAST